MRNTKILILGLCAVSLLFACSAKEQDSDMSVINMNTENELDQEQAVAMDRMDRMDVVDNANPLFLPSTLPHQFPRFDLINNAHYMPAFERGMEEQLQEIDAIVNNPAPADFENTVVALEKSGELLNRVSSIFFALSSAHTNDEMDAIETEIAPRLSAHSDQILLNEALFNKIESVYESKESLALDPESLRLVEETWKDFIRAGAQLSSEQKEQLKAINKELAELSTQFSQNVLAEVNASAVIVESREALAGLSETEIQAAADEADSRELPGKFVIPLLNTSGQPYLSKLENRELRQRIHETSLARGHHGGEYDNREIVSRTARLRAEKSALLGFSNYAEYVLQNQTAQTTEAVNQRLSELTPPAVANARKEAADLQAMINSEGGNFTLASWDWDFYAEKVREERYDFDATELRPYFEVDNVMTKGVFYAASQIYGISFEERFDLPVYQEDVRVFEVFDHDGETLAFLIMDLYARSSKRGGAWMNAYVSQSRLLDRKPVVGNHLNISEPPEGEPTLLTFDEVTTMFHEFGHALHGMFSDVTYPSFAGTSVPRDFVEFPSQVNEMWSDWPQVLANYAVHFETGEPMPMELLDKVLQAQKFNQGFASTEYLAASITDMALHQLTVEQVPAAEELMAFERKVLEEAGAWMEEVPPRYHLTYFSHIMGGYGAGYYSYIWSEVLDADTVEWFRENGGMTRENGQYFRDTLLSKGGSMEAMELFRQFRGRDPDVRPLLERRGLQ